jgi:hypothetical protein
MQEAGFSLEGTKVKFALKYVCVARVYYPLSGVAGPHLPNCEDISDRNQAQVPLKTGDSRLGF